MASAAGTGLDLQEVHRVFGGQRSVELGAALVWSIRYFCRALGAVDNLSLLISLQLFRRVRPRPSRCRRRPRIFLSRAEGGPRNRLLHWSLRHSPMFLKRRLPTEAGSLRTAILCRTLNKLVCGNVGAFPPRLQRNPADRVTCMRCQELLFSPSTLRYAKHPKGTPCALSASVPPALEHRIGPRPFASSEASRQSR
jgi:hypothetical protein